MKIAFHAMAALLMALAIREVASTHLQCYNYNYYPKI